MNQWMRIGRWAILPPTRPVYRPGQGSASLDHFSIAGHVRISELGFPKFRFLAKFFCRPNLPIPGPGVRPEAPVPKQSPHPRPGIPDRPLADQAPQICPYLQIVLPSGKDFKRLERSNLCIQFDAFTLSCRCKDLF